MKKVKAPPLWVFIVAVILLTLWWGLAGFLFGAIVAVVLLKWVLISPYNESTLQQIGPGIIEQAKKISSWTKNQLELLKEKREKEREIERARERERAKMREEQNTGQTITDQPPAPVSTPPRHQNAVMAPESFELPGVCVAGFVIAVLCYIAAGILFIAAVALMSEARGWGFVFGGWQSILLSLVMTVAGVLVHLLTTIAAKTSEVACYVRRGRSL